MGILTLIVFISFSFLFVFRSRHFVKREKELQEKFSQRLLEERERLARELHDDIGQLLALIKKKAETQDRKEISELAQKTLNELRTISRGLYPPMLDQLGLTEAICQLIYDFDQGTNLFFTQEIDEVNNSLSKDNSVNFYRFVQEALNNIIKHAEAQNLFIHGMACANFDWYNLRFNNSMKLTKT